MIIKLLIFLNGICRWRLWVVDVCVTPYSKSGTVWCYISGDVLWWQGLEGHLGGVYPVNIVAYLLMKLSSTCFLMRRLYYILNTDSLKLVYFAHFHSIVKYGIIFWGNQRDVNKLFILQKMVLRIMLGLGYRSWRVWFKQLELFHVCIVCHWRSLWSLTLKLTFLYIINLQRRKIIFINHWLNLHRYKGALVILPLRYLINCHWTLSTWQNAGKNCIEKAFTYSFFIMLMNF